MADFFKGLSGGFQTGLQISEALRAKQERERLREAMGLTPQEMQQRQATPEELGRAQAWLYMSSSTKLTRVSVSVVSWPMRWKLTSPKRLLHAQTATRLCSTNVSVCKW